MKAPRAMKSSLAFVASVMLAFAFAHSASADPLPQLFHPGTGMSNPGQGGERPSWSEPPDLNGLIGSSEQILTFGLETEIANDFVPSGNSVTHVDFWGGAWNNSVSCQSDIPTPGINLRFYEDAGCVPGTLIADIHCGPGQFTEESAGCQSGYYPLYKWGASVDIACVTPGGLYWFGGQVADHAFPPQFGRLAATHITSCDSMFKSAYYGYPDWAPCIDVFGVAFDASQEFDAWASSWGSCCWPEGGCTMESVADCGDFGGMFLGGCTCDPNPCSQPTGACCLTDGSCQFTSTEFCARLHGQYQGDGTSCVPNPCHPTAVKRDSWGGIKALYR